MMTQKRLLLAALITCFSFQGIMISAYANDVLTVKNIGMELARDIANKAVLVCREQGYQVSAIVVGRSGNIRAALRDDLAARFTLQIAEEKANAAILAGISSGTMRENRDDIRTELNHMKGIIILRGALIISAGGYRIGAVGVSGAPGGDKDEDCARKALESVEDRLEFATE